MCNNQIILKTKIEASDYLFLEKRKKRLNKGVPLAALAACKVTALKTSSSAQAGKIYRDS
jgi:hypothetical protein